MTRFALTINGHDCIVDVPADMQLLELLRDELGLPLRRPIRELR